MTLQEEYDQATKCLNVYNLYGGNYDYKDIAEETYCACINYIDSGEASEAFKAWIADAPDGLNCPRAWMRYEIPE